MTPQPLRPLSPKQLRLLRWISLQGRDDVTDIEMSRALGMASRGDICRVLTVLERDGWIERRQTQGRGRRGRRAILLLRDAQLATVRGGDAHRPKRPPIEERRENDPAVCAEVERLYVQERRSLRHCADTCGFPSGGTAVIRRILARRGVAVRNRNDQVALSRVFGQDPALPWPKVERAREMPAVGRFEEHPASAAGAFVYGCGLPEVSAGSLTGSSGARCAEAA